VTPALIVGLLAGLAAPVIVGGLFLLTLRRKA